MFIFCRYTPAVKRTTAMFGHPYGGTGGVGHRVARFFPSARRAGIGLFEEPRQVGQKSSASPQRTKTEVRNNNNDKY